MKKLYILAMAATFAATAFAQRGFTPPAELSASLLKAKDISTK